MFGRNRRHSPLDIWPGFVDAMATLLMVIVFVLMTFVVAQLYLTDALNTKDINLQTLETQLTQLKDNLKQEQFSKEEAQAQIGNLQKTLDILQNQMTHHKTALENTEKSLAQETKSKEKAIITLQGLQAEIDDLEKQTKVLNLALAEEKSLGKSISDKLEAALVDNEKLISDVKKLKDPKKLGLTQFRSEFFAKLMKIVGKRSDIRIVDDRFIFQSEVLFDKGSADVRKEGVDQLKDLAKTLREITKKIPDDINWVLRVDGHTDQSPINTTQFPSNWELSTARAIAVVKALVKAGIDPAHLVAAGFGEFHPLSNSKDEEEMARNRRIEFKLDQK